FAFHAIANERAGEDRIFTHIFECPSVARFARQVHTAAKSHVVALRAQFAADERAVCAGCMHVPTCGSRHIGRQRRGVAAIFTAAAHAVGCIAHLDHGYAQSRHTENKTSAAIPEIRVWPRLPPPGHAMSMEKTVFLL